MNAKKNINQNLIVPYWCKDLNNIKQTHLVSDLHTYTHTQIEPLNVFLEKEALKHKLLFFC